MSDPSDNNIEHFKIFLTKYNVISYAAGMIVALSLNSFIISFVENVLMPGINMFLLSLNIKYLRKVLPGKEKINLLDFFNKLISFIFILITTYFVIYYTMTYILHL